MPRQDDSQRRRARPRAHCCCSRRRTAGTGTAGPLSDGSASGGRAAARWVRSRWSALVSGCSRLVCSPSSRAAAARRRRRHDRLIRLPSPGPARAEMGVRVSADPAGVVFLDQALRATAGLLADRDAADLPAVVAAQLSLNALVSSAGFDVR